MLPAGPAFVVCVVSVEAAYERVLDIQRRRTRCPCSTSREVDR
jgi:hypothetical protein